MILESKKYIVNFLAIVLFSFTQVGALAGDNLTLFGDTLDNKVEPNCYLRKEFNYFMNQWTTNEVCNPHVYQVPPRTVRQNNQNQNKGGNTVLRNNIQSNNFQENIYSNSPVRQTNYGTTANTYSSSYNGYYTGNNNSYTNNNWNGYGSSQNYLLSSFGNSSANYYYPNSVAAYTPNVYLNNNYSNYSPYYSDYYSTTYYPSYDNEYKYDYNYDNYDFSWGVGYGFAATLSDLGYSEDKIWYLAGEEFGF